MGFLNKIGSFQEKNSLSKISSFSSSSSSIHSEFKLCVVLEKGIESDMKSMITYNRVRVFFKFVLSIIKMKSYDELFSVFELTEKQLIDLISEEHRELFLYVCAKARIERNEKIKHDEKVKQSTN